MKKTILFALILLGNGIVSAQIKTRVKVLDQITRSPLPGVVVNFGMNQTETNEKGLAEFEVKESGKQKLNLHLFGYVDVSKEVMLNEKNSSFTFRMISEIEELGTIELEGIRAGEKAPIAFSNLSEEQIENSNTGRDVAFALEQLPSVVATSDAGAGIGYSGFRVRGSDATRINVTVNGIPLNDPESHGVWWVNTPDLMSSTSSMQLQRGVGTSSNGAGAFGASLNMQTSINTDEPFGEIHLGGGSFNTQRATVNFGSGLINDHFWIEGRLSKIKSDGYVDRASSDLTSYFVSGGFKNGNTLIKAVVFGGNEETYQSWNGVDSSTLATDRTSNSAGALYDDNWNVLGYYDNEVDNYSQDHYQLHWTQKINAKWSFTLSGHYTYGRGYYEQYKQNEGFAEYGLTPIVVGSDTISSTDLIRRKWLDNDFYGTVFNVSYKQNGLNLILGGGYNEYVGRHYGEIIWARNASDSEIRDHYYDNESKKTDLNVYVKASYDLSSRLSIFGDLQLRKVDYNASGVDDGYLFTFENNNVFFNPKAGVNYQLKDNSRVFASFGVAHKEPNRTDLLYADPDELPVAEQLQDLEVGYQTVLADGQTTLELNGFYMFYNNQLVLTGEVDNVGSPIRKNVGQSYRTGIEITAVFQPVNWLRWSPTLTLSSNKNTNYREEKYSSSDPDSTYIKDYGNTSIAYSPGVVAASNLEFMPVEGLSLGLFSKYVGEQYLSNSDNENHKLESYFINDIRVAYDIPVKGLNQLKVYFNAYNVFDVAYVSNGYKWGPDPYYFAQAGINFMGGVHLKF